MVGAVGERYRTIAFGTLVVAIYTTLTYIPDNSSSWFINPVMILLGTLLYSIVTIIVYLFSQTVLYKKVSQKLFVH